MVCILCWILKEDIEKLKFLLKFYDEFDKRCVNLWFVDERCVNLWFVVSFSWGWFNVSNLFVGFGKFIIVWLVVCVKILLGFGLIMKILILYWKYLF